MAMSIGSRLSSAAPSHSSAVCATNLRTAARRYLKTHGYSHGYCNTYSLALRTAAQRYLHDSRVLTRALVVPLLKGYGVLTCSALHKWEAASGKRQVGSGKWEAVRGNR